MKRSFSVLPLLLPYLLCIPFRKKCSKEVLATKYYPLTEVYLGHIDEQHTEKASRSYHKGSPNSPLPIPLTSDKIYRLAFVFMLLENSVEHRYSVMQKDRHYFDRKEEEGKGDEEEEKHYIYVKGQA